MRRALPGLDEEAPQGQGGNPREEARAKRGEERRGSEEKIKKRKFHLKGRTIRDPF